jgi:hypothetical protein
MPLLSHGGGLGCAETPGSGKLAIEEKRSLQLNDSQDLGKHIHNRSITESGVYAKNAGRSIKYLGLFPPHSSDRF